MLLMQLRCHSCNCNATHVTAIPLMPLQPYPNYCNLNYATVILSHICDRENTNDVANATQNSSELQ
jgi:hypothetical protein